jgi:hypothetical protein
MDWQIMGIAVTDLTVRRAIRRAGARMYFALQSDQMCNLYATTLDRVTVLT